MGARIGALKQLCLLSLFLCSVLLFAANPAVFRGQLTIDPSHPIEGLSWNQDAETQEPVIHRCKASGGTTLGRDLYCVQVQGQYSSKTRRIMLNSRSSNIDPTGKFSAEYPIKGNPSEFVLQTLESNGNVREEQKIKIYIQDWENFSQIFHASSPGGSPPRGALSKPASSFSITPGAGVSYITYQQSGLPSFSEWAATGKLSTIYALGAGWYLNASGNYTVTTFAAAPVGPQLSILTVDARLGYQIASRGSPWGYSILGGWNYITSFNAPGGFGFVDTAGPELMLLASYRVSREQQLLIYFKPTLITTLDTISSQNVEYAEGLSYFLSPTFGLTLDLTQLSFQSGGLSSQANTYTLAGNIRF